ncbi:BON domain-containing protein [Candidatus Paracaedibacter symbiosus]|uniref:BON domain-containing protein n=1 Tax=Candidatus Paracaedibacter symbiosus TaxID=244582 RepID=UPI000509AA98|nr:BON domain-containing protein [Candidatus Paracaedibacter symbiosus]
MKKTQLIASLAGLSLILSGCAPAIIGGAAAVGGSIVQEKGVSGNITDSQIATKIKVALYQNDPDLYHHVNVTVQNGEVLLTGNVATNEMHIQAVKISWDTKGVKRVIDNMTVAKQVSASLYAKDTWITTQIKTQLLFEQNIQSMNYSIKTVSGNVYLMGIAQNQAELEEALDIIRHVDGVKKVISYVRLKDSRE